jgi:radical SAM protein with 4Fe4S-binding SPASM domain
LLTDKVISKIYDSGVSYVIISCYDGPDAKKKFEDMFASCNIAEYEIRDLWFEPGETTEDLMDRSKFNNRSGAVNIEHLQAPVNMKRECNLPFYKLVLDWNGEALLCCNDWFRRHKGFGNINKNTLEEIWFGKELTKTREMLANKDRSGPACRYCNIDGTVVGTPSVKLLMNK